jgi:short-subunit dehydrogenase
MGNILISGASSGIGAALARGYAAPGMRLVLWGRNADRLEAVAAECRKQGAETATCCFDLTDLTALRTALDGAGAIDIAIFNAGLGGSLPHDAIAQDPYATERMATVNFTAPAIGANVMADRMGRNGGGKIVLIGSIAGMFPLPMAPVYSGSKAGLAMFADALEARVHRYGVRISLVSPGFVDTPMSQGLKEPRPFLIDAAKAAAIIQKKVARGARHIALPWQFALIAALAGLIPKRIVRAVLAAF